MPQTSTSEGSLFSQGDASKLKCRRGGDDKSGGDNKTSDKNYWKNKEFYNCGK